MMFKIKHQIADLIFETQSDFRIPHLERYPFTQFQCEEEPSDVTLRFHKLEEPFAPLPPLDEQLKAQIRSSANFFQLDWLEQPVFDYPKVRAKLQECLDQPEQVNIQIGNKGLFIRDFVRSELDMFCYPVIPGYFFSEPVMVARYRNLLAAFLPKFSAVMVHSSGVVRDNVAGLFLASDNGGKSTVAKHANGSSILNDDHVILRKTASGVFAYPTPFGVVTNSQLSKAELGGFFMLEKATHFELTSMNPKDILRHLWLEHEHHRYFIPSSLKKRSFELLYDAVHFVPVHRMRFPKHLVDWDAVDTALRR
jgi:hypothetical protein